MTQSRYFVDLFAGCGGLSLGLEHSGFIPTYVNELNKDALETYLLNRDKKNPLLREKYNSNDIKQMVKSSKLEKIYTDMMADYGVSKGELDLVVGGLPCQGFSIIGHRRNFNVQKMDLPYNYLYRDMVMIIKYLQPKCFLFENVAGLLSGKWNSTGTNGGIWSDVKKNFSTLNYKIRWSLIHSREYGVPQNRPRIIMVGLRDDMTFDEMEEAPAGGMLPYPISISAPNPIDILSDLVDPDYLDKKSTDFYVKDSRTDIQKRLRGSLKKGDVLTDQEYGNHSNQT